MISNTDVYEITLAAAPATVKSQINEMMVEEEKSSHPNEQSMTSSFSMNNMTQKDYLLHKRLFTEYNKTIKIAKSSTSE